MPSLLEGSSERKDGTFFAATRRKKKDAEKVPQRGVMNPNPLAGHC